MGIVIQCESRNVEHALVELNEFDPEVLYCLHQPGRLYVVGRKNAKGRDTGNWCTPDYLVVRRGEICLVECKPASALRRNASSPDPRFVRDDAGDSGWPAAEAAAAEMGLGFRVFSSEEVNPTWHRNVRFLADFFQTECCPDPELARVVKKAVSEAGSVRITEVLALPHMKPEVGKGAGWILDGTGARATFHEDGGEAVGNFGGHAPETLSRGVCPACVVA